MLDSPYAGLMPFTEAQAPFFFGRDHEREIIVANLLAAKLTLLYGPSGVGKSSVLDAGVVHQLRRESLDETNGSPAHIVVSFRNWRDEPLAALERTIEGATTVKAPGATFADRLDGVTEQIDGDLLLILDQFEEYFMYHPGEEAETSFAAEFSRAVNRQNLRVSFLLSMREDSIAKLDFFKGRIPNLFDNYLRIDRLRRQQAEEAIVRPLEQFNRMFGATEGEYTIEPALVATVLDQVRANRLGQDEAGRGGVSDKDDPGIETPHLQLVMTRLWREERQAGSHVLRLATLQRLGGPGEIVKRHVDAALDALTVDERDAAARIFQYLVTPAGTKIALGVEDLAPNADLSPADLRALLVKLSAGDRRILTPVAPAPDQPTRERYQIFHDVLAEKVLGWRRRYVAAAEQRAAERVAQEERLKAEREARAAAKLRRLLVVVVALLAVSIAAGWIAWQQNRTASSERRRADLARRAVDLATSAASENEARARESEARFQASKAQSEKLVAEKTALQQRLDATEAAQAGRAREAAELRRRAAEQDALARAAADRERQATAEAAKAAAEAKEAQTTRERLAEEIKQTTKTDTPVAPPPTRRSTEETPPPAPPPSPAPTPANPEATPGSKPSTPVGNYRTPYRQAVEAKNRRRWQEAARLFEDAIRQNPTDTGENISISGAGNFEPYVPNYYLGLAYKNLGDCSRALEAWKRSESDGSIRGTNLYKSLEQNRRECLARK